MLQGPCTLAVSASQSFVYNELTGRFIIVIVVLPPFIPHTGKKRLGVKRFHTHALRLLRSAATCGMKHWTPRPTDFHTHHIGWEKHLASDTSARHLHPTFPMAWVQNVMVAQGLVRIWHPWPGLAQCGAWSSSSERGGVGQAHPDQIICYLCLPCWDALVKPRTVWWSLSLQSGSSPFSRQKRSGSLPLATVTSECIPRP